MDLVILHLATIDVFENVQVDRVYTRSSLTQADVCKRIENRQYCLHNRRANLHNNSELKPEIMSNRCFSASMNLMSIILNFVVTYLRTLAPTRTSLSEPVGLDSPEA